MQHIQDTSSTEKHDDEEPKSPFGRLPNGRTRLCGAWTMHGTRLVGTLRLPRKPRGGAIAPRERFVRLRCKCWSCSLCGPHKAIKYRGQIMRAVHQYKLHRFLTLTLDARKLASGPKLEAYLKHFEEHKSIGHACSCDTCTEIRIKSIRHIRKSWDKLRYYMHRKFKAAPTYVAVIEFQKVTGLAHLHIVIDRFIDQKWVREAWQALGGGQHVDIRHVDVHRAAAYLSKYLSKDVLLNSPTGMRRVTTSRSVKLNPKKISEYLWERLKAPIDRIYLLFALTAEDPKFEEGELSSFVIWE
jgi:hypothetical protein